MTLGTNVFKWQKASHGIVTGIVVKVFLSMRKSPRRQQSVEKVKNNLSNGRV